MGRRWFPWFRIGLLDPTLIVLVTGRMTAVFRTLLFGGGTLGGLFAGLLAGRIGARGALTVAAIGSGVVVLGLDVSPVSRLRKL